MFHRLRLHKSAYLLEVRSRHQLVVGEIRPQVHIYFHIRQLTGVSVMLDILKLHNPYLVLQCLVGTKLDTFQTNFRVLRFVSAVTSSTHFSVGWK